MLTYNIDSFKSWNWYRLDEKNESALGIHLVCSSAMASSINLTVQSHPPLPLPSVISLNIILVHYLGLSMIKAHDVWYYLGTYIDKEIYCFLAGGVLILCPLSSTETTFDWKTAFTAHVDRSVGRRLRKVTFKWIFTDCVLDRDLFAAGDKSNVSVSQMNCVTSLQKPCNCRILHL